MVGSKSCWCPANTEFLPTGVCRSPDPVRETTSTAVWLARTWARPEAGLASPVGASVQKQLPASLGVSKSARTCSLPGGMHVQKPFCSITSGRARSRWGSRSRSRARSRSRGGDHDHAGTITITITITRGRSRSRFGGNHDHEGDDHDHDHEGTITITFWGQSRSRGS